MLFNLCHRPKLSFGRPGKRLVSVLLITSTEALEVLQNAEERGDAHHAFFKEAVLGRFFAICNCCSCCCGALQIHRNGIPMLASSGYVSQVDAEECIGCGTCTEACQFNAICLDKETAAVDETSCMGCGLCVSKCPQEVLTLVRNPSKGEPLEIDELIETG